MISIEDKLKELHNNAIQEFKNELKDLEMLLSDAKEKRGGLYFGFYMSKTKEEINAIYNKTLKKYNHFRKNMIDSPYGWEYFEDVCYLESKILKEFDNLMIREFDKYNLKEYPKDKIFISLNKLAYFKKEINYLEYTQKRFNRDRIRKQQPTKEILKILKYIGNDNQATEPLVKLLYDMDGDFSCELSAYQRDIYFTLTEKKELTIMLNIDELKRFKGLYRNETNNLLATIKEHRNRYAKLVQTEILNLLE